MRINKPIKDVEYPIDKTASIVSKTDLRGVITYANDDFVEVSGFSREELLGKPHNMVRHPDVPPEVFKDMWNSLKVERPWTGVVKNRRKNGDYYWLLNNVAPYYENDYLVGYMSVRLKASREQIEEAEHAYRLFREGKAGNLQIRDGKIVNATLWKKLNPFKDITVKSRLIYLIAFLSLLMMVIGVMGLRGMSKTNEGLHAVYQDRTVTMGLLFNISELQRENLMLIASALVNPNPEAIKQNTDELDRNIAEIARLWNVYLNSHLAPEEQNLASNFSENSTRFVRKGLAPAIAALRASDLALADKIRQEDIRPLYKLANQSIRQLMQLQIDGALQVYQAAQERYQNIRNLAIGLTLIGIALALWLGFTLMRAIVPPLETAIGLFRRIAQGHYDNAIDTTSHDEIGKVMAALKAMQIKCGYDISEAKRIDAEYKRIMVALDNVSTGCMITDSERRIIYANKAVIDILSKAEAEIRRQLPNFSIAGLIGASIDNFHSYPLHQAQMLSSLSDAHSAEIEIGGRLIALTARPVIDDAGQRLGTVVEWQDRTEAVTEEKEVDAAIKAAINGDFSRRIEVQGKDGFSKLLGEGLNELLNTTENALNDLECLLHALAHRDLSVTINNAYPGSFGQLKEDANIAVQNFRDSFNHIKGVMQQSIGADELFAPMPQNAAAARESAQLTVYTYNLAQKGGAALDQVALKMAEINDCSRKIAGIIAVLDDIVLQTGLLAHSASIEAVRAGEQGHGFEAVAKEMRDFAQRAAGSVGEIKMLCGDAQNKAAEGCQLSAQTEQMLEEIVSSLNNLKATFSAILDAATKQAAGLAQLDQTLHEWKT